jgi:cytoskeleton-associated protein 5
VKEFAEKAVITAPKEKSVKPAAAVKPVAKTTSKTNVKKPVPKKVPTAVDNEDVVEKPQRPVVKAAVAQKAPKAPVKPAAAAASSKVVAEEILGSNLPVNNLKSQRISDEMKLRILKWNFTIPREVRGV